MERHIEKLEEATIAIIKCFENGGKILTCGNGGSSSDANHFCSELMKSFEKPRPLSNEERQSISAIDEKNGKLLAEKLELGLPAISLTGNMALLTAIINDIGGEYVFAQQVNALGRKGDILVVFSTSGNSVNIVNACITAKAKDMKVIAFTGRTGGKVNAFCDIPINIPQDSTAVIQEHTLPLYHTLCQSIEKHFFNNK